MRLLENTCEVPLSKCVSEKKNTDVAQLLVGGVYYSFSVWLLLNVLLFFVALNIHIMRIHVSRKHRNYPRSQSFVRPRFYGLFSAR